MTYQEAVATGGKFVGVVNQKYAELYGSPIIKRKKDGSRILKTLFSVQSRHAGDKPIVTITAPAATNSKYVGAYIYKDTPDLINSVLDERVRNHAIDPNGTYKELNDIITNGGTVTINKDAFNWIPVGETESKLSLATIVKVAIGALIVRKLIN